MKATKLVLGTVQFGLEYGINNTSGKPDLKTVFAILDTAYRNNITLLDTAEAYGNSQEIIGEYHKQSPNRFKVITKFKALANEQTLSLRSKVLKDIELLHVDHLYAYMFHSFNDFETHFESFKNEITGLKAKGLIKKFGVSIYTNEEFEKLLNFKEVDLVQLPFNLLDNESQRGILLGKAQQQGIEVHTRSVFLQGLFFKEPDTLSKKLLPLKPYLEEVKGISRNNSLNLSALSLNYVLQQNKIDHVLIGVDTVLQLEENLSAMKSTIVPELMNKIDSISVKETELLNPSNWN